MANSNKVVRHSHGIYFETSLHVHYVSHSHPVAEGALFEHRHRLIESGVVRVSSRTWSALPDADKMKVEHHA